MNNLRSASPFFGLCFLVTAATASRLPDLGAAPDFVGHVWKNTPHPIHLADLQGKVVLVHFWTLDCINCKHNLGAYNAWQSTLAGPRFQIVSVHTPETRYESMNQALDAAIAKHSIKYPVLVDNDSVNWNRWHQQFWPAIYLVDKHGRIRDFWSGELEFDHAGGTAKLTKEILDLEGES